MPSRLDTEFHTLRILTMEARLIVHFADSLTMRVPIAICAEMSFSKSKIESVVVKPLNIWCQDMVI